jgi:hypothetical protein
MEGMDEIEIDTLANLLDKVAADVESDLFHLGEHGYNPDADEEVIAMMQEELASRVTPEEEKSYWPIEPEPSALGRSPAVETKGHVMQQKLEHIATEDDEPIITKPYNKRPTKGLKIGGKFRG